MQGEHRGGRGWRQGVRGTPGRRPRHGASGQLRGGHGERWVPLPGEGVGGGGTVGYSRAVAEGGGGELQGAAVVLIESRWTMLAPAVVTFFIQKSFGNGIGRQTRLLASPDTSA